MRPLISWGRYCIFLDGLDQSCEFVQGLLGLIGQEWFQLRPDGIDREVGGVRGQLDDRQSGTPPQQLAHTGAEVGVEIVPNEHDRAAKLASGKDVRSPLRPRRSPAASPTCDAGFLASPAICWPSAYAGWSRTQ